MGAVVVPFLVGLAGAPSLPHASSLCGACSEACPVKIPLHELLLDLRRDLGGGGVGSWWEGGGFGLWSGGGGGGGRGGSPFGACGAGGGGGGGVGGGGGGAWASGRALPRLAA